jgi:DNA-binding Lrp family transcriptional regulator
MFTAFVFLNCELGKELATINIMNDISGVSEAVRASGVYDIMAKVSALSREHVSKVVKKIRAIADIRSSLTMVVAEDVVKHLGTA